MKPRYFKVYYYYETGNYWSYYTYDSWMNIIDSDFFKKLWKQQYYEFSRVRHWNSYKKYILI